MGSGGTKLCKANGQKQSHWAERGNRRPVKWREHIIVICLHLLDGVDLRILLNTMGRLERSAFVVGLYIGRVYNLTHIKLIKKIKSISSGPQLGQENANVSAGWTIPAGRYVTESAFNNFRKEMRSDFIRMKRPSALLINMSLIRAILLTSSL